MLRSNALSFLQAELPENQVLLHRDVEETVKVRREGRQTCRDVVCREKVNEQTRENRDVGGWKNKTRGKI